MWGSFEGHRAANVHICCFNFVLAKAKIFKKIEIKIIQLCVCYAKLTLTKFCTKSEVVKNELHIKSTAKSSFNLGYFCVAKALLFQCIQ